MPAPNATAIQDAKDDLERLVNRRNAIEERPSQIKAGHQIDARPVEEVVADAMMVIARQRTNSPLCSSSPFVKPWINSFHRCPLIWERRRSISRSLFLPLARGRCQYAYSNTYRVSCNCSRGRRPAA